MHLGGVTIPDTIDNHGRYKFEQPVLRVNANNEAVRSIYANLLWTFEFMEMSDYTWICSTLLSDAASLTVSSAQLKDDLGVLQTYTNAVVMRPTYEYAAGGLVNSVTWEIKRIR